MTQDYEAIQEQVRALEEKKEALDQSNQIDKAYFEQELEV